MEDLLLQDKLIKIQTELKAPKSKFNNFGKYAYRSCEDILEAVKPLLIKYGCLLTIEDEIVAVVDRVYVKATCTISSGVETRTTTAFAREDAIKKGMDGSQITGSSSSYARKYALNGMFLIDDTKDADTDEHTELTGRASANEKNNILSSIKQKVADGQITYEEVTNQIQTLFKKNKFAELDLKQARTLLQELNNGNSKGQNN